MHVAIGRWYVNQIVVAAYLGVGIKQMDNKLENLTEVEIFEMELENKTNLPKPRSMSDILRYYEDHSNDYEVRYDLYKESTE